MLVKTEVVVTVPAMVRLLNMIFVPVIVRGAPVIVSVPVVCVNVPAPLVRMFPETFIAAEDDVIPDLIKLTLLKFCAPVPLIRVAGPSNVIVLLLPVSVPLFVQCPRNMCAFEPALKVVDCDNTQSRAANNATDIKLRIITAALLFLPAGG